MLCKVLALALALAQGAAGAPFAYLEYADVARAVDDMSQRFPNLVDTFTAQERYGLPSPGSCGADTPCVQHVVRITNKATLPDPGRPQVFFSGELHGNERVGPTTLIKFAYLLLNAHESGSNPWLERLVNTRVIVIMPMTNALGYYRNTREEAGVDPNRDFPIDSPRNCMATVAARAANEVWREHLFQLALTYHGGMQAIAFEWGTLSNLPKSKRVSPDDSAMLVMGSSMSAFAGAFNEGRYPHGRLNDEVYPVRGGMEDWGYAGSWLSKEPCNPTSFGGYPRNKTVYNDAVLRAFNILIECSSPKRPRPEDLGGSNQMLRPEGVEDGHVPRNVRLALFMTDMVQPYVEWVRPVPEDRDYAWEVGGAAYVDETFLEYWYTLPSGAVAKKRTAALRGKTRWTGGGVFTGGSNDANERAIEGEDINLDASDDIHDREKWPYIPAFAASLDLPDGATLLNVTALAKVDQSWAEQPKTPTPKIPPQSHVVNARTNAAWAMENNGFRVTGRLWWASAPIRTDPVTGTASTTDIVTIVPLPPTPASASNIAYSLFLVLAFVGAVPLAVKLYKRGSPKYTPIDVPEENLRL